MKTKSLDLLETELQTYNAKKQELLSQASGKYVLIKADKVIGIFDTESDAIRQGYEKFGNEPFLVKQILEIEPTQNFLSNSIAF